MENKKNALIGILMLITIIATTSASIAASDEYVQFESNIPKVTEEMLYPGFWIKNTNKPSKIIATSEEIEAYNFENVLSCDPVVDLENYQQYFTKEELRERIEGISKKPTAARYDKAGKPMTDADYDKLLDNLNLDRIEEMNEVRYGVVVKRTEMRMFPTHIRLFSNPGDYEIDRLMETTAYPAEPLVILSTSKDEKWYFAQMYNYLAWIPVEGVALTTRETLFSYVNSEPFLVVTGKHVSTNYNPLNEKLSQVSFDMGVRLPLAESGEIAQNIYGQNPAGNYVVKVPTRNDKGNLAIDYALIPRLEDVNIGYLAYNKENIIEQAFKLQGERYGWGGMFNGRDCTAFIMDIFRTMGIKLPRNSSEQGKLAAGIFHEMGEEMSIEEREKLFNKLEPGAGLYMSGHAMLYLGKYKGEHYMIHDFSGFYGHDHNGNLVYYNSREVAVTPLSIVLNSSGKTYMEGLYGVREFILEK